MELTIWEAMLFGWMIRVASTLAFIAIILEVEK